MPEWNIEPIGRQHNRDTFFCAKEPLDRWLKKSAMSSEEKGFARTYVAVRPGEVLVRGYYTISPCHVNHETLPLPYSKQFNLRLGLPALRLCRLAVDVSCQKQGLGSLLLTQAMRRTVDLFNDVGCVLLILETREGDVDAQRFYEKYNFLKFVSSETNYFLPVKTIEKLGLRPISKTPVNDDQG